MKKFALLTLLLLSACSTVPKTRISSSKALVVSTLYCKGETFQDVEVVALNKKNWVLKDAQNNILNITNENCSLEPIKNVDVVSK